MLRRFAPLFCLTACATEPGTPTIQSVEPERIEASLRFELRVQGAGFGLGSVRFDLDDGQGQSSGPPLSAALLGPRGVELPVPSERVSVEGPRSVRLDVRLDRIPTPGLYGVRLLEGTRTVVEREAVLELLSAAPEDAGSYDVGGGEPDVGPADVAPADAGDGGDAAVGPDSGPEDTGPPPEPFYANYGFRQPVTVDRTLPEGVTIRVPLPHAAMVEAGRARADAADVVVVQDGAPLRFQWEDRTRIGTNDLVMVVAPNGGGGPLVLYTGDANAANAPTDAVFMFSERFEGPIPAGWFAAATWLPCERDRSVDGPRPGTPGAVCIADAATSSLFRQTIATPPVPGIGPLSPGQVFEMRLWLAGRTEDSDQGVLYFSHGPDNADFAVTTEVEGWTGFGPNRNFTFTETNNRNRTVQGWRFSAGRVDGWREAQVRFTVSEPGRSLHLRQVNTRRARESLVAADDWTVRVAADPEPEVSLGPVEPR